MCMEEANTDIPTDGYGGTRAPCQMNLFFLQILVWGMIHLCMEEAYTNIPTDGYGGTRASCQMNQFFQQILVWGTIRLCMEEAHTDIYLHMVMEAEEHHAR